MSFKHVLHILLAILMISQDFTLFFLIFLAECVVLFYKFFMCFTQNVIVYSMCQSIFRVRIVYSVCQ